MSNNNPTLSPGSSTIGGLSPVPESLLNEILNFEIPVAYQGANYKILPLQFMDKKFIAGLDKLDNTADLDKPVSRPQQEALNFKANKSELDLLVQSLVNYRRKDEAIGINDIQNLETVLSQKLNKDGSIAIAQVQGLAEALLALAPKEHRHKLTDAEDWAEFSQAMRESLQSRPTVAEVENMLQVALAEIDVQRLATAVVWDPVKSRW